MIEYTSEQLEQVHDIVNAMIHLIEVVRPDYSLSDCLNFWRSYFRHPAAGDMLDDLERLSREPAFIAAAGLPPQ
jgi:hypothetical protein